jgi:hypothetical protein
MMTLFKYIIIVQLFFSFGITILSYAMPADSLNHVTAFSDVTSDISIKTISGQVQDSVEDSLDIPVIELGALVFYSGNIIIDLLLNFFFAIPEMIGLLVNGFMLLFNVDSYIFAVLEIFFGALVTILYFIGVLQLLMNIRGRGSLI